MSIKSVIMLFDFPFTAIPRRAATAWRAMKTDFVPILWPLHGQQAENIGGIRKNMR